MDAVGSSRGSTTIIAMGPNHPMRPTWDALKSELGRCPTFDELVRRHYAPQQ